MAASVAWSTRAPGLWRFSRADLLLVSMAALHAAALVVWPSAALIAIGVWWSSNTIAHNFIHRPFFRLDVLNRLFSAALSVELGIPQRLWRDRHLAHHTGARWRLRMSKQLACETALVAALWAAMAVRQPRFFLWTYIPGYLAGLGLCGLQGYWEHAAGCATSNYGRIYNWLCFNDGFHAEHHADPSVHWTELPRRREAGAEASHWPALLRWLETLERAVLLSPRLQQFMLRTHGRAFRGLLPEFAGARRVAIVGGGLFPRTALILRELLPDARLVILDANRRNLELARDRLGSSAEYRHDRYQPGQWLDCDLAVIPLCLAGDRRLVYRHPPSSVVLVHDWLWRRAAGAIVSPLLLKRLNLVRR